MHALWYKMRWATCPATCLHSRVCGLWKRGESLTKDGKRMEPFSKKPVAENYDKGDITGPSVNLTERECSTTYFLGNILMSWKHSGSQWVSLCLPLLKFHRTGYWGNVMDMLFEFPAYVIKLNVWWCSLCLLYFAILAEGLLTQDDAHTEAGERMQRQRVWASRCKSILCLIT